VGQDAELLAARARVDAAGEAVNRYTYETARRWLAAGKLVGTLGGDHSVPFGSIRAHVEHFGELGILHLDAHADLRVAYEGFTWSHASIMERVLAELPGVTRLVQVGIRDLGEAELHMIRDSGGRIQTYFDPLLVRARLSGRLPELLRDAVRQLPQHVYLSFDIDGLDPRYCPGTGTPVPGGLELAEVSLLLEAVVEADKTIVGFDLVEVAPRAEGDQWDGNVGARLLYKMIGWALQSRSKTHRELRAAWGRGWV
jgi:agmatinase